MSLLYKPLLTLSLLAVTALNTVGHSAQAEVAYTITDLGTLGGTQSEGYAINDSGEAVGDSGTPDDKERHAFLYSHGKMTDIDTLANYSSTAWALNNKGEVTGGIDSGNTQSSHEHAFLYSHGRMCDLGTLGGAESRGVGISDKGQVTGYSMLADNKTNRAFLYSNGKMRNLGTIGGGTVISMAVGINNKGQIIGARRVAGPSHVSIFLYADGAMQPLKNLQEKHCVGVAINEKGQILVEIGHYDVEHACLYNNGTVTDLGTLGGSMSNAKGMNDNEEVVGYSTTGSGRATQPFVYSHGRMRDLNTLIEPTSGWVLCDAQGINNQGQIVGTGVIHNRTHAFILTPIKLSSKP